MNNVFSPHFEKWKILDPKESHVCGFPPCKLSVTSQEDFVELCFYDFIMKTIEFKSHLKYIIEL